MKIVITTPFFIHSDIKSPSYFTNSTQNMGNLENSNLPRQLNKLDPTAPDSISISPLGAPKLWTPHHNLFEMHPFHLWRQFLDQDMDTCRQAKDKTSMFTGGNEIST
jgi:hypothetical protein